MKAVVCSLVLAGIAIVYADQTHFEKVSVRSKLFEPLRVNKTFETIKQCNYEVQKPYGILEKTFTKRLTNDLDICWWKLSAPENHLIHVISITIDILDDKPYIYGGEGVPTVYLYDGSMPEKFPLFRFSAKPEYKYNPFVQSLSSGRHMMINLEEGNTQKEMISIKYEFINIDKIKEIMGNL